MSPVGEIWSPFIDYAFMRRALAGCAALSVGAAPLGTILLLRRMSLVGDAMSHAILPGAALGYLLFGLSLPAMSLGGLLAGLLATVLGAGWTLALEGVLLLGFVLFLLSRRRALRQAIDRHDPTAH